MTGRHVVVGPARHGVVLHATRLAAAHPALEAATLIVPAETSGRTPAGLGDAVPPGSTAFLHVTDRLFGSDPEQSAQVIRELGSRAVLGLSLHDVPQPAEGEQWYLRRRAAYREFALLATVLVVASNFEKTLLLACLDPGDDAQTVAERTRVIPLPVERLRSAGPRVHTEGSDVAVLGYLYPGKGLEDVIDAAARLRSRSRRVTVTNYGAAAQGHSDLVGELTARARSVGVEFLVTGYLTDGELAQALGSAGVPVAPHRHISASGSLNTWAAAGRRPIVRRGGYADELDARLPGAVVLADSLEVAIEDALDDPGSTWLQPSTVLGPTWTDAAEAHLRAMAELP
ncbi:hypothetical protein [Lapillicoccus sp.]|uniref:hypothetical protein n=1 Tax=Lapillicoccus sp. TaxID=1909287 RepID=UPI003264FD47